MQAISLHTNPVSKEKFRLVLRNLSLGFYMWARCPRYHCIHQKLKGYWNTPKTPLLHLVSWIAVKLC